MLCSCGVAPKLTCSWHASTSRSCHCQVAVAHQLQCAYPIRSEWLTMVDNKLAVDVEAGAVGRTQGKLILVLARHLNVASQLRHRKGGQAGGKRQGWGGWHAGESAERVVCMHRIQAGQPAWLRMPASAAVPLQKREGRRGASCPMALQSKLTDAQTSCIREGAHLAMGQQSTCGGKEGGTSFYGHKAAGCRDIGSKGGGAMRYNPQHPRHFIHTCISNHTLTNPTLNAHVPPTHLRNRLLKPLGAGQSSIVAKAAGDVAVLVHSQLQAIGNCSREGRQEVAACIQLR